MDNFNFNQIRLNQNLPNQNKQAGMVSNSQNLENIQAPKQNETLFTYTNRAQNVPLIDYSTQIFEIPKMETLTVLKYLQNLLNLPNTIDKFIAETKNPNSKLIKLLVENLIGTKELSEFLNKNSKEAILKVLDTITTSLKSGMKEVGDLKEVLKILNVIQNVSKDLSANTIRELLLLYIPLEVPVFEKKVDFTNLSEEQKQGIKEADLSILFETNNFSNILITLTDCTKGILIDIFSNNSFPKEKFETILKTLSKEANINILTEFKEIKTDEKPSKNQNFSIISNDYVSTNTLLMAHIVIKAVLKIDNDFS